jgi:hypothetical protein
MTFEEVINSGGVDPQPAAAGGSRESTPSVDHELTATDILSAADSVTERVDVPEWGGHLFVRNLTGEERDTFEDTVIKVRGKNREVNMRNFRAKLVAMAACDSAGKQLFTMSQVEALGKKNAAALQRVFDKASSLSGLGEEDIEQMTQELGKDQNGSSGSA